MSMMTAKVIGENKDDLKKGFVPVAVVCALFLGIGMLPKNENGKLVYGKIAKYPELYIIQAVVTILMVILLGILIYVVAKKKVNFLKVASAMTAGACVLCMATSVYYGVAQGQDNQDYIDRAINGADNLDMEKLEAQSTNYNKNNSFYRIDTSENVDNWCMFWNLSSMRCFHSVVSTSIMDFYSSIGQTRDVASRMNTDVYPLRSLFSVKYFFNQVSDSNRNSENVSPIKGFRYVDTQNGFHIYENENYIPMGFAFDNYVTNSDVTRLDNIQKTQLLMKALVLDPKQAVKYNDVISYQTSMETDYSFESYKLDCLERKSESCSEFSYNSDGFDAKITLSKPKLVFFSVPYDKGWSAQVNGENAEIEKVDYGFMAVLCKAGENTIHFSYKTYGMTAGKILTAVGFVSFAGYMTVVWYCGKKKKLVPAQAVNDKDTE